MLECGLNVVGRTRFCIHPAEKVNDIPIIGGTKSLNKEELLKLSPDLVIMDKEENKKEMAEELWKHGIRIEASQIDSIQSAANFLKKLSVDLANENLANLATEYAKLDSCKFSQKKFIENAVINCNSEIDFKNLSYVIWKSPYMIIGPNTFIADVLKHFDIELVLIGKPNEKYPIVSEEDLKKNFGFYSSEPYPFEKEFEKLTEAGFRGAYVNGEKISWYGIRNLKFLQSCLE